MRIKKILKVLLNPKRLIELILSSEQHCHVSKKASVFTPFSLLNSSVGDYSYIGPYSHLSDVEIGKFCSIGPHFFAGWGIHPIDGISTHPFFYSSNFKNSFSQTNKVVERKKILIGNDVFIGVRVTILDGVTIGDGAVIGAGAVVIADVDDYAIVAGCPAKLIRYRFNKDTIRKLKEIQWWHKDIGHFKKIEVDFFNVEKYLKENI